MASQVVKHKVQGGGVQATSCIAPRPKYCREANRVVQLQRAKPSETSGSKGCAVPEA